MVAETTAVEMPTEAAASLLDAGSLPFAVVLLRANDGTVAYANNLMSMILRIGLDELIGKTIPGLYEDSEQRSKTVELLKRSSFVPAKQIEIKNFDDKDLKIITTLLRLTCNIRSCTPRH